MENNWYEATQLGDYKQVQTLLGQGADINSLDKYGQTALMNASYRGDYKLVELLVNHGAELNHTAKYKLTALMLAVINKHREVVKILIKAGANTELKGSKGFFECTPLEYERKMVTKKSRPFLKVLFNQFVNRTIRPWWFIQKALGRFLLDIPSGDLLFLN